MLHNCVLMRCPWNKMTSWENMLTFASLSTLIFVLFFPLCWVLCLIMFSRVSSIYFLLVDFYQILIKKYDFDIYKVFLVEKSEINILKFENEMIFESFNHQKLKKKIVKLLDFSFWFFNIAKKIKGWLKFCIHYLYLVF